MPLPSTSVHIRQETVGYCLPACVAMALAQLGMAMTQRRLAQMFATRSGLGTPFSNILRVEQLGVRVQVNDWAGIDAVVQALALGQKVVSAVMTTPDLPGWDGLRTQHAVLVIHVDTQSVAYHDPANESGPSSVSRDAFCLAWSEMDERVAFLSRQ
ncbi:MAG TPA: C39 family peptidase [Caldilineaceae bacterium]|nr:C39 family peptidase [Caldilineaceae bacterium]